MAHIAKVIEVIGTSENSWQEAADNALAIAQETISHISGIQVEQMSADVEAGRVTTYRTTLKVAFAVERSE
jgi:hypothetical protein